VRVLLATAGLLVLAGSAAAGPPTAHTLRKSANGPIVAIAQDGTSIGWLSSSTMGCNAVHVLAPGTPDQVFPTPSSSSTTCHWNLTDGQPQLAIATRISMALWTLHESGPAPFDYVLAAPFGGRETQIGRIAHASDGTGGWLEGLAGSGRFLAYSWADDEYVDKLGCLSGGSCKRTIAGGGINIVTQTGSRPLPNAYPALQLAASAGRIAYIRATRVPANRPAAGTNSTIYVVDAGTGDPAFPDYPTVAGVPAAIALSPHVLAVLTQKGPRDRISWFSATTGTKMNSVLVSSRAAPQLAASDKLIVYRVYRKLYGVSTATGRVRPLGKMPQNTVTVGPTVGNGQLVWAENRDTSGRLRALAAG
jgi:hypothetical protein